MVIDPPNFLGIEAQGCCFGANIKRQFHLASSFTHSYGGAIVSHAGSPIAFSSFSEVITLNLASSLRVDGVPVD
ncbi:hypothetical protein M8C21_019791 [Ambrosia artemisiifolia]|uniref:Uncharacterized protein n=1 Tax=Ambrosia artemisiifolia TaxID=4212 RepID=A0AAD5G999_AMBAR|nr:hypothetical protein M8C21_019791 [Ambrosia artemisiifolia]